LVLLAMLVAAPMATRGATAVASSPGEPLEVPVHAAKTGETRWGCAEQMAKPGDDVRDADAWLQECNEMRAASVRVGQLLLLPDECRPDERGASGDKGGVTRRDGSPSNATAMLHGGGLPAYGHDATGGLRSVDDHAGVSMHCPFCRHPDS